jgi:F0F1-type ATP synthase membrane subunit b/b'
MMLQKEKQQREEAERQRKELEEKLQRYEEEFEGARKGMTDICRL